MFHLFDHYECYEHSYVDFCVNVFISLVGMFWRGLSELYDNSMLNFSGMYDFLKVLRITFSFAVCVSDGFHASTCYCPSFYFSYLILIIPLISHREVFLLLFSWMEFQDN